MIAKLTGIIDSCSDTSLIIDVNGVGYLVFCSAQTFGKLKEGETVALMIETHVREDQITLYGFLDALERKWFCILVTVQGVGARVALAILGLLTVDELIQAIAVGDKAPITQTPGVGPKLAQRILSELKDKAGDIALGDFSSDTTFSTEHSTLVKDAASALVNLGYKPSQALAAVTKASAENNNKITIEILIREGLAILDLSETVTRRLK